MRVRRLGPVFAVVMLSLPIGIGAAYGTRVLDRLMALLILAIYAAGSAVLVFKALGSRPQERRRIFSCGELALLPESWRRWLLDEKRPAAGH